MSNAYRPILAFLERWPVRVGFALLGIAWLIWLLGLVYGARFNARFAGRVDDVGDSLRRHAYISQRLLAFDAAALAAEVAAGCALFGSWRDTGWGVTAWTLLVSSALLHGSVFLAHWPFAG